jgi:hypothetical protein
MELLPAHQPLLEDDTDEDMSDEQMRELLNEAAARMRAKAAGKPTTAPEVPFKLPKLRPGHLADTYEKTDGSITRLDHSKLIDKKQQELANGIKKIDDPLVAKKQRLEVCTTSCFTFTCSSSWQRTFRKTRKLEALLLFDVTRQYRPLLCTAIMTSLPATDDNYPILLLSRSGSRLGYLPAELMRFLVHSYTEAHSKHMVTLHH